VLKFYGRRIRKSTLLTPSFETSKKYFLDGKDGQNGILYLSGKKKYTLYTNVLPFCNTKEEKPCLMSLFYWGGGGTLTGSGPPAAAKICGITGG
jgi:hypothetical protein